MMINKIYRRRLLVVGIILGVVIPLSLMLAPFCCATWALGSGSVTQDYLVETIRFAEKFHWVKEICGIAGSILLVGLYIDYLQRKKKELR